MLLSHAGILASSRKENPWYWHWKSNSGAILPEGPSYIVVSDSGDSAVNGRYDQTGPYEFTHAGGFYVLIFEFESTLNWHIYDVTRTYHYYYTDSVSDPAFESINGLQFYAAIDGAEPPPYCYFYREEKSHKNCILVAGANVSQVNGIYRLTGGTYFNEYGYYFVDQEATGQHWIKHDDVSPNQFYIQATTGNLNPWDSFYVDVGGGNPAPAVTLYREPQYAAIGVWKDQSGTIPAEAEGDIVQAVTVSGSKGELLMSVPNSLYAMKITWDKGIPALQKAGAYGSLWFEFIDAQTHDSPMYLVVRGLYTTPYPIEYSAPVLGMFDTNAPGNPEWNDAIAIRHRPDHGGVPYLGVKGDATFSEDMYQNQVDTALCFGINFNTSVTQVGGVIGGVYSYASEVISETPLTYNRIFVGAEPYDFQPFSGTPLDMKIFQFGFRNKMLSESELRAL